MDLMEHPREGEREICEILRLGAGEKLLISSDNSNFIGVAIKVATGNMLRSVRSI